MALTWIQASLLPAFLQKTGRAIDFEFLWAKIEGGMQNKIVSSSFGYFPRAFHNPIADASILKRKEQLLKDIQSSSASDVFSNLFIALEATPNKKTIWGDAPLFTARIP